MSTLSVLNDHVKTLRPQTLDELWREAEMLGRIKVDKSLFGNSYEVTIHFERQSGTGIYAKGCNTDICFAVSDAINEARTFGAGSLE